MQHLVVFGVVAVTTAGALLLAGRLGRLSRARLRGALSLALECVGLSAIFLIANVALALATVLAVRGVTGHFVSVYVINDLVLVALSVLQALFARRLLLSEDSAAKD
jgi:hypothetical protein